MLGGIVFLDFDGVGGARSQRPARASVAAR